MAKPPKNPVRGPYDTPFMTKRQREREAQKTARDAVESVAAIESRTGRERLAAEAPHCGWRTKIKCTGCPPASLAASAGLTD